MLRFYSWTPGSNRETLISMPSVFDPLRVFLDGLIGFAFLLVGKWLPRLYPKPQKLVGQTAIVTGGDSGIGRSLALQLAEMGATVWITCREEDKAVEAREYLLRYSEHELDIEILQLDCASFKSIRSMAQNWTGGRIDILCHNAELTNASSSGDFSGDGFDVIYETNVLSCFMLTYLLEPYLSKTARIVFTSSVASYAGKLSDNFAVLRTYGAMEKGFHYANSHDDHMNRYAQTKLMQVALARSLQERFDSDPDNERLAFAFEPGLAIRNTFDGVHMPAWKKNPATRILSMAMPVTGIDASQSAATGVHLATSKDPTTLKEKGHFFIRMQRFHHPADLFKRDQLDRLWIRLAADAGLDPSQTP